jgi:tetratricopeptide (TPR) repeat protein
MKKNPWLKYLENASLLGSGMGAVASIVLNQASYAVAPLTIALALGALNRNREDQTHRQQRKAALTEFNDRFTLEVRLLKQQMAVLPTPETIHRLKKGMILQNRELAQDLYAEVALVQGELHRRLVALEEQKLTHVRQDLQVLSDRYVQLSQGVEQLQGQLQPQTASTAAPAQVEALIQQLWREVTDIQMGLESLTSQTRPNLALLQEQLSRLDREMTKRTPAAEHSSMRREMSEVIKLMAELTPKRETTALSHDVQDLQQQQDAMQQSLVAIETAVLRLGQLYSQAAQTGHSEQADGPALLSPATAQPLFPLEAMVPLEEHPELDWDETIVRIYPELQNVAVAYLGRVRSQLEAVQHFAENLAEQQRQLQTQVNSLPQTPELLQVQHQLNDLTQRLPSTEQALDSFKARVQQVVQQELAYINQHFRSLPAAPQSELVFDVSSFQAGSRELSGRSAMLTAALQQTEHRLILIWPWSPDCHLDDQLLQDLEQFLQRHRRLDLGWCHQAERSPHRLLSKMQRGWMSDAQTSSRLQASLRKLLALKQTYADRFQFKILGTTENFLVSDQSYALLGIADGLQTATHFPELQLRLRTHDPQMIQRLIQRYDYPELDATDLAAYWNRAVTRYDLGDKLGAIADYTHILSVHPDDAIAHNYRGLAHYEVGHATAAMADFTTAIALNPEQAAAYCNRAFIRAEQGDLHSALDDYNRAVHAQPDCAIAYFYRGMTWQKLENHQEAISDYTEALYLSPQSAVSRYYRGLAWHKVANLQGAMADLSVAANLFSVRGQRSNAQKAQKQLAKLQQLVAANPTIGTQFGAVPTAMISGEPTSIAS